MALNGQKAKNALDKGQESPQKVEYSLRTGPYLLEHKNIIQMIEE